MAASCRKTQAFPRRLYFTELLRLQRELIKLQDWVVAKKLKIVVVFEGRDAAGKGGVIKRFTQRLNPRVCRTVALPAPTERERSQWYFQRYVPHLPAGGEIVLFDRSWYNRAGVERVMGFCNDQEYEDFFQSAPEFERLLVRSGIILVKYWFSITDEEQNLRFTMRINDPLKQWKLSPMDLQSRAPLGGLYQGQGVHAGADPYPRGAVVGGRGGRQEARPAELHRPSPDAGRLSRRCRTRSRSCRRASTIRNTTARRSRPRCTCPTTTPRWRPSTRRRLKGPAARSGYDDLAGCGARRRLLYGSPSLKG